MWYFILVLFFSVLSQDRLSLNVLFLIPHRFSDLKVRDDRLIRTSFPNHSKERAAHSPFPNRPKERTVFHSSFPNRSKERTASDVVGPIMVGIAALKTLPKVYTVAAESIIGMGEWICSGIAGLFSKTKKTFNDGRQFCHEQKLATQQQSALHEQLRNIDQYHVSQCSEFHQTLLDQRISLINITQDQKYTRAYSLNDQSIELLRTYDIESSPFRKCYGNALQQHMHNEFIQILNRAGLEGVQYQETIVQCSYAGIVSNSLGQYYQAFSLADACWTLLEIDFTILEGVTEGVESIAKQIRHPIKTVQDIASGLLQVGCFLGEQAYEELKIMEHRFLGNHELVAMMTEKKVKEFDHFCSCLGQLWRETPGMEKVRVSSKIITESFLTAQLSKAVHSFIGKAKKDLNELSNITSS